MDVVCKKCGRHVPDKEICVYCGGVLFEQIQCAKCNKKLPHYVKTCQYCGTPVGQAPTTASCPGCGKQIPADKQTCQYCGAAVTAAAAKETTAADATDHANPFLIKGQAREITGDYAGALEFYNQGLQTNARAVDLLCARGFVLDRLKRHEEALTSFDQALAVDPRLVKALTGKISALNRLHRFQEALSVSEGALSLSPDNVSLWFYKAVAEDGEGKTETAMASFARYLELEADKQGAGAGYARTRLKELKRSTVPQVKIPPSPADPLINQATALLRQGQPKAAAKIYLKALKQDPRAVGALINLGVCAQQLGDTAKALKLFDRATQLMPNLAGAWLTKGICLQELERYEEALSCLQTARKLNPGEPSIANNIGACLNAMDRAEDALKYFLEAVEADPGNIPAWLNRAWTEDRLNRPQAAMASFKTFLKLAPDQMQDERQQAQTRLAELEEADSARVELTFPSQPLQKLGSRYEIYKELGRGGFGVVYLAVDKETQDVFALKTFLDRYLTDARTREMFKREAEIWISLDRHPYLVRAYFVQEIAGRLYIAMQFIAPDEDNINTLEGWLARRPLPPDQTLRWAVQFCHGIEFAYARGIRCHRDIKPANILIDRQKNIRISDFGLAGAITTPASLTDGPKTMPDRQRPGRSLQTIAGGGCGTPTHMPPEQWQSASACDERSDIYAFGVTLFQMVSRGRPPFLPTPPTDQTPKAFNRFIAELRQMHLRNPVPETGSPLEPIIRRCMAKNQSDRYQSFGDLQVDLAALLENMTGETLPPPVLEQLDTDELYNKALSLEFIGNYTAGFDLYEKILEKEPSYVRAWIGKAVCLDKMSKPAEALRTFDKAVEINPENDEAWSNKGECLVSLERYDEALACFDRALALNPNGAVTWRNKGVALAHIGRFEDALRCFDKGLEIEPSAAGWNNKGFFLNQAGRYPEALAALKKAVDLDPLLAVAWRNQADSNWFMGRFNDALQLYDRSLQLDSGDTDAWGNKGGCLLALGKPREALACIDRAIALSPEVAMLWNNKGNLLMELKQPEAALPSLEKALELDPQLVLAHRNKGLAYRDIGKTDEALAAYEQALQIDARDTAVWYYKGDCLKHCRRLAEAAACFENVIRLEKNNRQAVAMAWFHRGECFRLMNRLDEAVACYNKALEIIPNYEEARLKRDQCRL